MEKKNIAPITAKKSEKKRFMKRLYGPADFQCFLEDMTASMTDMHSARRKHFINHQFGERIMMAVTEVNGCRYCSYFHTQVALKAGLSQEEIQNTLGGVFSHAPTEEVTALFFAQHYAEQSGKPQPQELDNLYQTYGILRSKAILAYIRAIMVGNAWGNAFDALRFRLRGKPQRELSLGQELKVILMPFYCMPFFLIKRLFSI